MAVADARARSAGGAAAARTASPSRGSGLRWGATTQYALCIARAIVEARSVQLPVVAAHLRRWAESRDYRHPSAGLLRFLVRLRRGAPWDACAVAGWRGRGGEALAASVPLAAWLWSDAAARAGAVRGVLHISQRGRRAGEAACLAADALAWALVAGPGVPPPLAEWERHLRGGALRKRVRHLERALAEGQDRGRFDLRSAPRSSAAQVVAAALGVSEFGARPFEGALAETISWGDAGRHAAALAGALVGARQGEGALGPEARRDLEDAAAIGRLAEALGDPAAGQRRGLMPVIESAAAGLAARAWRAARVTAGIALLLLGLVGLFLPVLQGVLFLFSGLAILGAEFRWARDLLRRVRFLLKRGLRRLRPGRRARI